MLPDLALILVFALLFVLTAAVILVAAVVAIFLVDNRAVYLVSVAIAMATSAVASIVLLDSIVSRESWIYYGLLTPVWGSFVLIFGWLIIVTWIVNWKTIVYSVEIQTEVNWRSPRLGTIAIVLLAAFMFILLDALLTHSTGWGLVLALFYCTTILPGSSASNFVRWYIDLRSFEDPQKLQEMSNSRLAGWAIRRLSDWATIT